MSIKKIGIVVLFVLLAIFAVASSSRSVSALTAVKTPTRTPTKTSTKTPTRTPTKSPTSTPTKTATKTPTKTATNTATKIPVATRTNVPTKTNLPTNTLVATRTNVPTKTSEPTRTSVPTAGPGTFTMAQTLSDQAQQTTIAFDGLAFLTGGLGADSFFPPGKVADFWGFQYLRDNDPSGMGHNTDFLTSASLNMFSILTADQKAQLITLAKSQVSSINQYGYNRFVLMTAFRRMLAGDLPAGTTGLNEDAVKTFSAGLYHLDGQISFERAQVMGGILYNLNNTQKTYLAGMVGKGMTSWPTVAEPTELRSLTQDEKVAVMTYSGDLFSWYAGSIQADVYFCPERQGTYFGSFYMKDAPAVGNPGYSIGTNITADMGKAFEATLTTDQDVLISGLVNTQRPYLTSIVDLRTKVSTELRKFTQGQSADSATVLALMDEYGRMDGSIVYNFATNFSKVGKTLTDAQKTQLMSLRVQTLGNFTPTAAYLYAQPIEFPQVQNTDFLFK